MNDRGSTIPNWLQRCASRLVLLALTAIMPAALSAQNRIVGRVLGSNGEVIPFAAVQWEGAEGWTAVRANGDYILDVPAGTVTIRAQALGYRTQSRTVTVGEGGPITVNFALETRPLDVAGLNVSVLRPDLTPQAELEEREVREANPKDAGDLLREIEGVSAVRRGPLGLDPVVRGLRETEVGTYLDGTRLFPAGPARMDSPLTHLDPSAVRNMEVIKGPYALTWGAGNLSAVRVETQELPDVASRPRGNLAAGYDQNLGAEETSANINGRSGRVSYVIDGAWRQGNDYKAGDGVVIPGDYKSWEGRGKVGFDVGEGGQLILAGGYQRQGPIDYPGRLLNAKYFKSPNVNGAFEWKGEGGTLTSFEVRAYNNHVDHMMSNYEKPTAYDMTGRMPPFALDVGVDSHLNVWGGRVDAQLNLGGPWTGEIGGDVYSARRDATRTISRQSTGMVMFTDNMWPNAVITDGGGFARVGWRQGTVTVSGTVRGDLVYSDAQSSKVSQFFYDNNPSGGNLKATETNLSAALTTSFNIEQNWVLALGVGRAVRTADASERYSDRVPASKAQFAAEFMGDPQLHPEQSTQGDIWLDGRYTNVQLHLGAFARGVNNYITIEPTGLPTRLPLSPPTVYQYVNGDARFYGLEGSTSLGLGALFTLTLNGSYLYAQDTKLDEPAIGTTPLTGSAGLRYEEAEGRFYVEAIGDAVGKQTRVATLRGESPTPGYQTADLKGGFGLANGVTVRGGVLNVFDKYYWNHLNAKNPFTGMPVPEPGRVFFIDLAYAF